jgi:hypothetical protein
MPVSVDADVVDGIGAKQVRTLSDITVAIVFPKTKSKWQETAESTLHELKPLPWIVTVVRFPWYWFPTVGWIDVMIGGEKYSNVIAVAVVVVVVVVVLSVLSVLLLLVMLGTS